jgi:hypothetical protein
LPVELVTGLLLLIRFPNSIHTKEFSMDDKIRCQSCGMPLSDILDNYGTNKDGSSNPEYCVFCFKGGAFTNPHQTLDEMIKSSILNMTKDHRMPGDKAIHLANEVIPNLKRWKKA